MHVLLFVLLLAHSCLTSSRNDLLPAAFPFKDGYLGGDDIYSIELTSGRFVWLYGDTFWNHKPWNETRVYTPDGMPSNTVGITDISADGKEISFSYYRGNGEKPFGIFNHAPDEMVGLSSKERDAVRLWPKDGQMVNGKLWVSLLLIVESTNMFDSLGIDWSIVENPGDNPDLWRMEYIQTLRSGKVFPATAMHTHTDGFLYSLTTVIRNALLPDQDFAMLRYADAAILTQPEYLSIDGSWKVLPIDKDSLTIVDEDNVIEDISVLSHYGNTEASLHYDEDSAAWVLISGHGNMLEPSIGLMAAYNIEGPWSKPLTLIDGYPENDRKSDEYIEGVFCYAGKGHPVISAKYYDNAMPITYACNSFEMEQLLTDNRVYQPKTIVIDEWSSKIKAALATL